MGENYIAIIVIDDGAGQQTVSEYHGPFSNRTRAREFIKNFREINEPAGINVIHAVIAPLYAA